MKIDRLLEIIIFLLNHGTATAPELAERFGVSVRTIYRDIDVLSSSGIPVYANRGFGGGISLLEGFTLPKTIISKDESESILFSLQTLKATKYPNIDNVLQKLGALFQNASTDWIDIDFSPWGSNPNESNKLTDIKNSILNCKVLEFNYINAQNQKSLRKIEPLRLMFKGQAWYLWGWCLRNEDFRMFKISRIKDLTSTEFSFDKTKQRKSKPHESTNTNNLRPIVNLELKFNEATLYRLYDDYHDGMITKNPDNTYTLKIAFPEDNWVYGYILSFGSDVEIIQPAHIREIIKNKIQDMKKIYDDSIKI